MHLVLHYLLYTSHAELGSIGGTIRMLAKGSPIHLIIHDRCNFPTFTLLRVIAHILPARTEQYTIHEIFCHRIHVSNPLAEVVLTIIDESAVGLVFPSVWQSVAMHVLLTGADTLPGADDVGAVVVLHTDLAPITLL